MAIVKLADIPNAPDLASMSAARVNNVNIPTVDFSSQRRTIAAGYEQAMENPKAAGQIGAQISEVGQGVFKAANQYQEQQQKLNDTAAIAEFSTAYTIGKSELEDSLDQSHPETWAGQYGEWYQKKMMPMYEAMPTSAKQKFYPDLLKTMYEGQAVIGHNAHLQSVKNDTVKGLTQVEIAIQGNQFGDAVKTLNALHDANAISAEELASQFSKIDSKQQIHKLDTQIGLQPYETADRLERAMETDTQLEEFNRIPKEQYPQYIKRARDIGGIQQQRLVGEVAADVGVTLLTPEDVAKDPRTKKVRDPRDIESLKQKAINSRVTDAKTQSSDMNIMSRLQAFPLDKNNALIEAAEIQRDINNYASGPMADQLSKTLEGIKGEMAGNGGERKSEAKMGQYIGQRLEQVKIGNLYGKFHTDAEVRNDTTGKMAKENTDVLKRIEAVREAVQQKAPKNSIEADNAIQEVLQIEISKKNAGDIGSKKGFFDFFRSTPKPNALLESRPQASTGSDQGKITKYGYEKPGDADYDSNSARGIGAADNQLTPGESIALSPDLEKSTGAKIGDKVVVTLSNGDKMVKRFDDRTSKRLKGRVDIYSPDGNQPLDGLRVAKVEKYTEDGRG
jgi:hypothetical protein